MYANGNGNEKRRGVKVSNGRRKMRCYEEEERRMCKKSVVREKSMKK